MAGCGCVALRPSAERNAVQSPRVPVRTRPERCSPRPAAYHGKVMRVLRSLRKAFCNTLHYDSLVKEGRSYPTLVGKKLRVDQ